MLRNKEFRQFAAWFALAAVAAVVLGFAANTAGGWKKSNADRRQYGGGSTVSGFRSGLLDYLLWIYQKQIPEHCKDFGADRYGAP